MIFLGLGKSNVFSINDGVPHATINHGFFSCVGKRDLNAKVNHVPKVAALTKW